VSCVAGLLRKVEEDLQRGHVFAHVTDQRMQAFENFAGIGGHQTITVLLINL